MSIYVINLSLQGKSNVDLLAQAKYILSKIRFNPNYPNPKPSIAELETMTFDFEDAVKDWGTRENHGSSYDKAVVASRRREMEIGLTSLRSSCMNKTPNNVEAFLSAGFVVKRASHRINNVGAAVDLRSCGGPEIDCNQIKLRWRKPLGIGRGIVKTYVVFRNTEPDIDTAIQLKIVTKTTFLDKNLTEKQYFYWVVPVSAAGRGVVSDVCLAYVRVR